MVVGLVWMGKTVNRDGHGLQFVQTLQEGRGIHHLGPMATAMSESGGGDIWRDCPGGQGKRIKIRPGICLGQKCRWCGGWD